MIWLGYGIGQRGSDAVAVFFLVKQGLGARQLGDEGFQPAVPSSVLSVVRLPLGTTV